MWASVRLYVCSPACICLNLPSSKTCPLPPCLSHGGVLRACLLWPSRCLSSGSPRRRPPGSARATSPISGRRGSRRPCSLRPRDARRRARKLRPLHRIANVWKAKAALTGVSAFSINQPRHAQNFLESSWTPRADSARGAISLCTSKRVETVCATRLLRARARAPLRGVRSDTSPQRSASTFHCW